MSQSYFESLSLIAGSLEWLSRHRGVSLRWRRWFAGGIHAPVTAKVHLLESRGPYDLGPL